MSNSYRDDKVKLNFDLDLRHLIEKYIIKDPNKIAIQKAEIISGIHELPIIKLEIMLIDKNEIEK